MSKPGECFEVEEQLWKVQDVSEFLQVPVATIYCWRVRGDGPPALKLGKHLRYSRTQVEAWVRAQSEAA